MNEPELVELMERAIRGEVEITRYPLNKTIDAPYYNVLWWRVINGEVWIVRRKQ